MASLAMNPAYIALDVEDFLDLDLGDHKAELIEGVIYMMAGGSERHAAIAANLIIALGNKLRGSGCRPYGSDMPLRTRDRSTRFPDVTVYRGKDGTDRLLDNPKVVFEVLSPSTASNDQFVKLNEYLALAPVDHVVSSIRKGRACAGSIGTAAANGRKPAPISIFPRSASRCRTTRFSPKTDA